MYQIRRPFTASSLNSLLSTPFTTPWRSRTFKSSIPRRWPRVDNDKNDNDDQSTRTRTRKPIILRENIYTLPNLLTVSRIFACPVLGWSILDGNFHLATSLLLYAGFTDLADGYLARRYRMRSVLGTILDPAADKILMTTLTVTLTMKTLLPLPLAVIILGRDVLLSLSAFYIRYTSLPSPKTFSRYWDFSIPSAEVNTGLQLLLMGVTAVSPIVPIDIASPLLGLQWAVATTTVWSGLSYIFSRDAVRIVSQTHRK